MAKREFVYSSVGDSLSHSQKFSVEKIAKYQILNGRKDHTV